MNGMVRRRAAIWLLIPMLLAILPGCQLSGKLAEWTGTCGVVNEWVDFLILNDIHYDRIEGAEPVPDDQIGDKAGQVKYTMDDHPCSYHQARNGDAAYLAVGTPVFALKDYRPEFRVIANQQIYQVDHNPHAQTMGELLDIEGKVANVSLVSGNDGSIIGYLGADAAEQFVRELLPLQYVGFDEINKQTKPEYGISLRVHLQDGTSFSIGYKPEANAFTNGAFGTESLKILILSERDRIKAEAWM
ncbi:hypothetical protein COLU111180_14735 [Cohnella lubricantis]|uniref:Uncharacterized protein n=1 Tax=Cohnella lubricantis TaxID=2163172 RepID=A0A841TDN7_9BACL|nr:hypothetical protein [Cohnella lubricantis]MBB6677350.1 hypothetical protein [Cohnella lubricantis]MBP2119014.1 hypothetical protein [Cohnella lubricantis]